VLASFECLQAVSLSDDIRIPGTSITNPKTLLQWLLFKKGAMSSVACEFGGFFKTDPQLAQPDLQIRFVAARSLSADGIGTLKKFGAGAKLKSGFTTQIIACRPRSEGRVRLRSTDPLAKPEVEGVYLGDDADMATLRAGIRLGREIAAASSFDQYRGAEVYPSSAVSSDDELDAYIRSSVHSGNALTSSCRIGADGDKRAVLDAQLRVRGVGSLRVCDASAMPHIIGGQTCAPTIMLAEKAADMVLAQRAALQAPAKEPAPPAATYIDIAPHPMPMPMPAAAA